MHNPLLGRYVNPLTDFGFKRLFGEEASKDILTAFLNDVLPERFRVATLRFTAREQLGLNETERRAIFDVACVGPDGEQFIVELQNARQHYFKDRTLFYSTFPIQQQAEKNEWDFRLPPIISVNILNFKMSREHALDRAYTLGELKDQDGELVYDKLVYVYLELPRFNKTLEELESGIDRWFYLFKHLKDWQEIPALFSGDEVVSKLAATAEVANMNRQERAVYEDSLKAFRDWRNILITAQDESLEQGREEGREQGRAEERAKLIRKMKARGMSPEDIATLIGVSEEEVREF